MRRVAPTKACLDGTGATGPYEGEQSTDADTDSEKRNRA